MSSRQGPLLLTGASGWFGRTALWEYEQEHGPEALRREVIPFASRERFVDFDSPNGPVKALPLEAIHEVQNPAGLLHMAFLTRDKVDELGWKRYVEINRKITATVAQVLQAWPMLPVISTSSGAAAALDGKPPDLPGNPYATLKQEEEQLLERESATRMAMVFRVYAASGRFMTRPEKFALGDFILQALRGQPVQVKAQHPVMRSYVSVEQLMQLSWMLLLRQDKISGRGYQQVDACGPAVEMEELAAAVADELGASLGPRRISADLPDCYVGDAAPLSSLLERHGLQVVGLRQQIRTTVEGLRGSSLRHSWISNRPYAPRQTMEPRDAIASASADLTDAQITAQHCAIAHRFPSAAEILSEVDRSD